MAIWLSRRAWPQQQPDRTPTLPTRRPGPGRCHRRDAEVHRIRAPVNIKVVKTA